MGGKEGCDGDVVGDPAGETRFDGVSEGNPVNSHVDFLAGFHKI
jgi:hypothetical protein